MRRTTKTMDRAEMAARKRARKRAANSPLARVQAQYQAAKAEATLGSIRLARVQALEVAKKSEERRLGTVVHLRQFNARMRRKLASS